MAKGTELGGSGGGEPGLDGLAEKVVVEDLGLGALGDEAVDELVERFAKGFEGL
jgi:hypothetical protein